MTRPNGTGQFIGGAIVGIIGCLCVARSLTMDIHSRYDVEALSSRSNFMLLGSAALTIAALLFVVGWIIQAMSFLPGRGDATLFTDQPVLELTDGDASASTIDDNPSPVAWVLLIGGIIAALGIMFILTV